MSGPETPGAGTPPEFDPAAANAENTGDTADETVGTTNPPAVDMGLADVVTEEYPHLRDSGPRAHDDYFTFLR